MTSIFVLQYHCNDMCWNSHGWEYQLSAFTEQWLSVKPPKWGLFCLSFFCNNIMKWKLFKNMHINHENICHPLHISLTFPLHISLCIAPLIMFEASSNTSLIQRNFALYVRPTWSCTQTMGLVTQNQPSGKSPELPYTSRVFQEYRNPSLREAQEGAESVMCSDARKQKSVTFLNQ